MNDETKLTAGLVRPSDELGPDERAKLDALLDHIYEYGTMAEGVLRLAAKLCETSRAAERERCAKLCDSLGGDIDERDPDEAKLAANSLADAIRTGKKA
jgi:hypothetical protein